MSTNPKICIFGVAKDCSSYLSVVIENMHRIGKEVFDDEYFILIYCDYSRDGTVDILRRQQSDKFALHLNTEPMSQYRTHNIAKGRNYCIRYMREYFVDTKYFIMMDCDNVCSSPINTSLLKKYVTERDADWDALSFNKDPYYDIWALSIGPYVFSCYHFQYTYERELFDYITATIKKYKATDELIPCYSAFNGFAIYRTNKFINCTYYGELLFDYIPIKMLINRFGPISYQYFPKEDCEHRRFHFEAIKRTNARIRISPEILFDDTAVIDTQNNNNNNNSDLDRYMNVAVPTTDFLNRTATKGDSRKKIVRMLTT